MLDTIRLRLYGILDTKDTALSEVQKENGLENYVAIAHNDLYRKMLAYKGKNFSMQVVFNKSTQSYERLSEADFIKMENSNFLNYNYQLRDKIRFISEGDVKEINKRINGTYRVSSSCSDVVFSISENGSFIDFEFSIPKYLYGHNLAEFVPQAGSEVYFAAVNDWNDFDYQSKYLYKRLRNFINEFFSDLCDNFDCEMPNFKYLELRRLDMCFNQYFENEQQALLYLNEQRKINMKRQKRNANTSNNYATAITYKSKSGAYFKIYHKGSEYSSRGDLKKHMDINKAYWENKIRHSELTEKANKTYGDHKKEIWYIIDQSGKNEVPNLTTKQKMELKVIVNKIYNELPYKVKFLKQQMDRVLRYEISYTSDFFMSLYKRKCFRRNDSAHQFALQRYKKVKSLYNTTATDDEHYQKLQKKITREDRRNYKMFHQWFNRKNALIIGDFPELKTFCKKSRDDYNEITGDYKLSRFNYSRTTLGSHDVVQFDDFFLRQCAANFKEYISHYQVRSLQPYDDILARIKHYNDKVKERKKFYNQANAYKCKDYNNRQLHLKDGKRVTLATQLLTQSKLREKKLKLVNTTLLSTFITRMEQTKMSLDQIFDELKTPSSTRHRIKKDLEMFGVFSQTVKRPIDIKVDCDFKEYYFQTGGLTFRDKFFTEPKHWLYAQLKIKQTTLRCSLTA